MQILQASFSTILNKLKFIKNVWRERSIMRSILDSENQRFLQFAPPGHFYSPIPDIKELQGKPHIAYTNMSTKISGIDLHIEEQTELAHEFAKHYNDMPFPEKKRDGFRYYLDNDYLSYGDGVVLYSMMRRFKPNRVIEVGSGFSSAAMLDLNEKFYAGKINFTFVEPFPDRLFSVLRENDKERCTILRAPVQEIANDIFGELRENDILFVDSSHVVKAHSDVAHLLFNVLPSLHKGVIVHFHDILWPFEYPQLWLDEGRAWNEAYVLRAFLQYNTAFRILYFNSMMEVHQAHFLRREMPLVIKKPSSRVTPGNTSLWIRKVE